MVTAPKRALPATGEEVDVVWGRATVRGHVIETYAGTQPRIVVQLDAGEAGDQPTSVTVPLKAVEPAAESTSPWARAFRLERAVAAALERALGEHVDAVLHNRVVRGTEVDLVVQLGTGRRLLVDVKSAPLDATRLNSALARLGALARREGAQALLVVPRQAAATWSQALHDVPGAVSVSWASPEDDALLEAALRRLLPAEMA